ncbi:MAG: 4-hydroxy-3-methylbut-2-enyl diphosphate reductase [Verrucomicrobiia bacterium Tous-C2TDCM]|nr:MAG: 4-hydroxy-3-methylbut-2-enyl diphosphate reductase [Verrucomicrobiae bacterium Tous-C2TDCM]
MPTSPERSRRRVNVRTPEVMERVQAEVANHYQSSIVEKVRARGGTLSIDKTTIRLAQQFGFCYGVERAIDLAYASRRVFRDNRVFLIGEIIHNPEVNRQLEEMNIVSLPWQAMNSQYDDLTEDDVVIVPAFGAPISFMDKVESRGCHIVDTTCGDVMKVWKRVRGFAKDGITSIIHGKADHEETRATASRAAGDDGTGHFLVVLTLADIDYVCDYLERGGDPAAFRTRFHSGAMSEGFDPDEHLMRVGVANQTTMLKSETEEIQRRVREAIIRRDGSDANFSVFDTICGATQERQDALFDLLKEPLDLLLVVGGYNSSNTTHLVEIGEKELPTFFIRSAACLVSVGEILHYDIHRKEEIGGYTDTLASGEDVIVGITAGASCPSNLIEDTILKIFELRGVAAESVRSA